MTHVSASPPTIPDSRVSRVRFWPRLCTPSIGHWSSHNRRGSSANSHTPRDAVVCQRPSPDAWTTRYPALCLGASRSHGTAECPEPLCPAGCRPWPGRPRGSPGRALPLRRRSYGLMRQTTILLRPPVVPSCPRSLQVVVSPCWMMALPDIISVTLAWAPGPIPRHPPRMHIPSPSPRTPASRHGKRARRVRSPCNATSTGSRISGVQSFASLQAPTLARPPGCADRGTFRHRAAGPFTPRTTRAVTRHRLWHRYMSDLGD